MPKLRVKSQYLNRGLNVYYEPGAIVEVTEDERRFYLADSPGSFEDITEPTAKELPEPPKDKAIKRAPRSKRVRGRSEPNEET